MIRAVQADITMLPVDALVNAANDQLLAGGGVCGAIFRSAGSHALAAACKPLAPCPTGDARTTPGFNLPARFIIHAVGPVWHGGGKDEAELLASAYRAAMRELHVVGGRSIAFPAISTGIYGFPKDQAARIAVAAVRESLRVQGEVAVTFACFDAETLALHERELAA
jgi:O-acetyl-ADP-ribose deacetylase (regulator of RNase III)